MFCLLCFRVKDYIAGGLSSKIKDPDGGIHLAKAKADLGLMEEINAKKLKENFPVDGFTEDLNILPAISFGTIWRYMIEESDAKKQLSTAKPLVKGYNFFKSGHVLSIKCRESDGKFYVKSQGGGGWKGLNEKTLLWGSMDISGIMHYTSINERW